MPHDISGSNSENALPLALEPGKISYDKVQVSIDNLNVNEEVCIKDMMVEVALELHCGKDLDYISLDGPGFNDAYGVRGTKVYETGT
jgi:hypothetical protein